MITVEFAPRFENWRGRARELLAREIEPSKVFWSYGQREVQGGLFGPSGPEVMTEADLLSRAVSRRRPSVPAEFVKRSRYVACHRDPERWSLLYSILWRLTHGEPDLLRMSIDPEVSRFDSMDRSVHRDLHKMTAFVRFRVLKGAEGEADTYVAWYEPDHLIVELAAPFFVERFNGMRWAILTPDASIEWDGNSLRAGPGGSRSQVPRGDDAEALWMTYYASIFNPARIKERMMKKEMPVRYWKNLPESALISELIRQAPARLQEFHANAPKSAEQWMPVHAAEFGASSGDGSLDSKEALSDSSTSLTAAERLAALKHSASTCRACSICETATQTVFGEGPSDARIVFVGEQPGDQEDQIGRPFMGPAGQLLERAMAEAGLRREDLYLTNAVKHFKWKPYMKRRLHQRPNGSEISACKPWLSAELDVLHPEILVCLGATAAQSVLGKAVAIGEIRGQWLRSRACENTLVTTHPSAILRTQGEGAIAAEYTRLVTDLRVVARRAIRGGEIEGRLADGLP